MASEPKIVKMKMFVNLSTPEKILENLILTKYPGNIFKDQISKTEKGDEKIYCFSKLEYEELMEFLINYSACEFKIMEHSTGRFIEDNRNFINPHFYH